MANTTTQQDERFVEDVVVPIVTRNLLEDAIDWITKNMSPGDVYHENDLKRWARENGFVEEE